MKTDRHTATQPLKFVLLRTCTGLEECRHLESAMSMREGQWTKCGCVALHVNGAEQHAVVVLRAPEYSPDYALQGAVVGVVDLQSIYLYNE